MAHGSGSSPPGALRRLAPLLLPAGVDGWAGAARIACGAAGAVGALATAGPPPVGFPVAAGVPVAAGFPVGVVVGVGVGFGVGATVALAGAAAAAEPLAVTLVAEWVDADAGTSVARQPRQTATSATIAPPASSPSRMGARSGDCPSPATARMGPDPNVTADDGRNDGRDTETLDGLRGLVIVSPREALSRSAASPPIVW